MIQDKLLQFQKYQGTGNDFVLVDNRTLFFPKNEVSLVSKLCSRRFGVGADGLILLENDKKADFKMVYFNADGKESSMCGNGGRCIVAFAATLGIIKNKTVFEAVDGLHHANIINNEVSLKMKDVDAISAVRNHFFLDTGSPHHVQMTEQLSHLDVYTEGSKLRYGLYGEKGSNINFVEQESANSFKVRTYERGVEAETLSCGTGVTAVALAMHYCQKTNANHIMVNTQGGKLEVTFQKSENKYVDITLSGPATVVFSGQWKL